MIVLCLFYSDDIRVFFLFICVYLMIVFQKSLGASNQKRSKRDGNNMCCAIGILIFVLMNYII